MLKQSFQKDIPLLDVDAYNLFKIVDDLPGRLHDLHFTSQIIRLEPVIVGNLNLRGKKDLFRLPCHIVLFCKFHHDRILFCPGNMLKGFRKIFQDSPFLDADQHQTENIRKFPQPFIGKTDL